MLPALDRPQPSGEAMAHAMVKSWLELHDISKTIPLQVKPGNEAIISQVDVHGNIIQFENEIPFWPGDGTGNAPPAGAGTVWVAKANLRDMRNRSYCEPEDWQQAETVLLQDKSPVVFGRRTDKEQLMGIRILDGKPYMVPLIYLDNDQAILAKGIKITTDNYRDVNVAILRLIDLRRPKNDALDQISAAVQSAMSNALVRVMEMGQQYDAGLEVYMGMLIRKEETTRWGEKH
jgi:hypothetical protein